ncbi:PIG-M-domain-containing protein [Coniella lustricola]|uniref:GPI mannosyltransferase 1 n=1 Tax=Coniella lustricola TaxID=2025994 RepID=A0A2T3AAK2_9PEZI|nr:PIG-M-domain-containing protein [Coniella lustricola]
MAPTKAEPPPTVGIVDSFFASPAALYMAATALRVVMLLYGLWQDANSPLKYTDIDYLVFTDAARFVAQQHPEGPYARETYRYTPMLAWMLLPTAQNITNSTAADVLPTFATAWLATAAFSFGKILFALADLVAGWLIVEVLTSSSIDGKEKISTTSTMSTAMTPARARKYAAIWLLNPMVATISTRGSSEGLLAVLVMALLWAVVRRHVSLAALLLGFGVHFKIYPFIYAPAIIWWMDEERVPGPSSLYNSSSTSKPSTSTSASSITPSCSSSSFIDTILAFLTAARLKLAVLSLTTLLGLNLAMYAQYGHPFLAHTYLHHVTRIDHRHNFSPYNILLYLTSAQGQTQQHALSASGGESSGGVESFAFLPQLLLSCVLVPLVMAKKDLPTTMLVQTWVFVTFNKVCTSQYFLWYLVLLPLYLPHSSLLHTSPRKGLAALALWVLTQAIWLQQGYQLEFLGQSTFVPGLWIAALAFFLANCWVLGVVVGDTA